MLTKVLINLVFLVAFYFIGNLVLVSLKTEKTSRLTNYFFSLLTGVLITVVGWALWVTKFQTLYLALIPVIVWGVSIKPESKIRLLWKDIFSWLPNFTLFSVIIISCTVGIFCYKYMGIIEPFPIIPYITNDYIFYANVADHLNKGGYENFHLKEVLR